MIDYMCGGLCIACRTELRRRDATLKIESDPVVRAALWDGYFALVDCRHEGKS